MTEWDEHTTYLQTLFLTNTHILSTQSHTHTHTPKHNILTHINANTHTLNTNIHTHTLTHTHQWTKK
jgi:hypothetical protein